jgi:hypothetical protein
MQKRGFAALTFSMNTSSKMAALPCAALVRIHFRVRTPYIFFKNACL